MRERQASVSSNERQIGADVYCGNRVRRVDTGALLAFDPKVGTPLPSAFFSGAHMIMRPDSHAHLD
jgi:hypothetical protein